MTLDFLINVIVAGVLTGSVYGLMALGLSLIFGVMHVVNFAHGEMMVAGMYVAFVLNAVFGVDVMASLPVVGSSPGAKNSTWRGTL